MSKRRLPVKKREKGEGTALIDIEIFAYHVCMEKLEERYDVKADEFTWHLPFMEVVDEVESRMLQMMHEAGCASIVGAVGGGGLFRKKLDPNYKAHRSKKKPLGYGAVIAEIGERYKILKEVGLEADDVIAILHTEPDAPERTVICSSDKDFKTVPGLLYDPTCPDQGVIEISVEEADTWHLSMALIGDTADGYPGLPGVGIKTARAALLEAVKGEEWKIVVELFEKKGLTEKDAILQARLARILRHEDMDKNGKPKLWSPKKYMSYKAPTRKSAKSARQTGLKSGTATKKKQSTTPKKRTKKAGPKRGK